MITMKNINNVFLRIFFVLSINLVVAQQMPQYSQYLRNQFMVNPGAAGIYNFTDITVSGRMQWVGFENAPLTSYASFTKVFGKEKIIYNPSFRTGSGPVKNPDLNTGKFKQAIGGQLFVDQYGAFQKLNIAGTYSIHIPITKNVNLSFGAKIGYNNNSFNRNKAVTLNQTTDQLYQEFSNTNLSRNIMSIGSGLYLYSNKFFLGISADNLTRDFITLGSGLVNFDTKIHSNVIGGYKFKLNENLTLTPSFLIQYMQPAPVSAAATMQLEFKERLWCGLSYRNKDAVIGMLGMNISNRFKLGYSYDFSVSKINTVATGGHEIILGIMLR
jgi:type IX secretion system PorP/SprF family membrane protein